MSNGGCLYERVRAKVCERCVCVREGVCERDVCVVRVCVHVHTCLCVCVKRGCV